MQGPPAGPVNPSSQRQLSLRLEPSLLVCMFSPHGTHVPGLRSASMYVLTGHAAKGRVRLKYRDHKGCE